MKVVALILCLLCFSSVAFSDDLLGAFLKGVDKGYRKTVDPDSYYRDENLEYQRRQAEAEERQARAEERQAQEQSLENSRRWINAN